MGRQRPPIECELPLTYWVFGRPVSTRNDDGSKPSRLTAWRATVNSALDAAVSIASKDRGFVPIDKHVELRIIWLSPNPTDQTQPDVDNILKPLIDALNGRIITDDRQVHRILAEKAYIGSPPATLREIYPEILDDQEYSESGEVIVVRVSLFALEYQP